jgi:hypothetical protein
VPKVHTKPIKRPRNGFIKESKGQPKVALVWRTGLSAVPPDSVRCTRELDAQLFIFGNSSEGSAIIHRTVRCTTGQCPVPQGRATLNSPASGIRSAIIHRTYPVSQRSNAYFARNGRLQCIKCAPARAEDRARAGGTPDSLQDLSGAPPDSQASPQVRAPTVGTQRPGDVAGAPDSVRWRTGLSGAPYDSSLHQTTSLVLGAINTPTTPHSSHPSFPSSNYLQEL